MKTHIQLLNVWQNVNHIPGWLRILGRGGEEFDSEDLRELEKIDEEAIAYLKEAEEIFERNTHSGKEFQEEIEKEIGSLEMKEIILEGLNSQIDIYEKELELIKKNFEDSQRRDVPWFLRQAVLELNKPRELERRIQRLMYKKLFIENPEQWKKTDRVTPSQISMAKEFPFDKLLKFNSAGFALCPFHNEKRGSFYYYKKTNTCYCFSCKWSGDIIKFVEEWKEMSFKDAVKFLCLG